MEAVGDQAATALLRLVVGHSLMLLLERLLDALQICHFPAPLAIHTRPCQNHGALRLRLAGVALCLGLVSAVFAQPAPIISAVVKLASGDTLWLLACWQRSWAGICHGRPAHGVHRAISGGGSILGLALGFAGLYQITVRVPSGRRAGTRFH